MVFIACKSQCMPCFVQHSDDLYLIFISLSFFFPLFIYFLDELVFIDIIE